MNDIGEGTDALICLTNSTECCNGETGEWYFPNSSKVFRTRGSGMYKSREHSVVRLHRRKNSMMPTGMFRCEIPDISNVSHSLYVGVYPDLLGVGKIL